LTVVVPARNAARTIGEQLDALEAQEYEGPWDVVVADNGSTDGTARVVEERVRRWPGLRLVSAAGRRGPAHARNVGVAGSDGALLLFCDADDVVRPGWVAAHALALQDHALVAGAIDLRAFWPHVGAGYAGPMTRPPGAREWMAYAAGANLAVRRDVFAAAGGFDEDLRSGEDQDLSWRLQLAGHELGFAAGAVVAKRDRTSFVGTWRQHFGYGRGSVLLYRKLAPLGMPRRDVRTVAGYVWFIGTKWWRAVQPGYRRLWAMTAAAQVGRVVGSVRYRTLYL
jgi:glycosyltransferase involved in cell wall biosynthesis